MNVLAYIICCMVGAAGVLICILYASELMVALFTNRHWGIAKGLMSEIQIGWLDNVARRKYLYLIFFCTRPFVGLVRMWNIVNLYMGIVWLVEIYLTICFLVLLAVVERASNGRVLCVFLFVSVIGMGYLCVYFISLLVRIAALLKKARDLASL